MVWYASSHRDQPLFTNVSSHYDSLAVKYGNNQAEENTFLKIFWQYSDLASENVDKNFDLVCLLG